MDKDEIERLIADLRAMMIETGFRWALEQAEFSLEPAADLVARAIALIDAAEGVTVDLAEAELRTLDGLRVEDIQLKPDDDDGLEGEFNGDEVAVTQVARRASFADADGPRGLQRRAVLQNLVARRAMFENLRRSLGGDG